MEFRDDHEKKELHAIIGLIRPSQGLPTHLYIYSTYCYYCFLLYYYCVHKHLFDNNVLQK